MSVSFAACSGDEVEVYRIAKGDAGPTASVPMPSVPRNQSGGGISEAGSAQGQMPADHPPMGDEMQAPPPSSAPAPKDGAEGVGWTLPKGWTGEGASGMRLATFRYAGAVTTVVALTGTAGGDFANANRWRGQIGLGQLTQADFEKQSQFVQSGIGRVRVVDYNGESKRMIGAMLLIDGQTWFFKMTGTKDAAGKAKPGFLALVKSLKPKA